MSTPIVNIPSQGSIAAQSRTLPPFDDGLPSADVEAFIGIPYAQPPLGPLRFRPPQTPAPKWDGIKQSQWTANAAVSDPTMRISPFFARRQGLHGRDGESEDCLVLHVWRPKGVEEGANLPVLFWVHGGSFTSGAANQAMFDGSRLATLTNCIVVSCNYRLGVLGFLGSRELRDEADKLDDPRKGAGNAAFWDVVEALKWTKSNVARFGGDPDEVTAFGESAGSIMIHFILLSPTVPKGLFSRAYLMSGTASTIHPRTMEHAQAGFDHFLKALGVPNDASPAEKLAALRSADSEELQKISHADPPGRPRTEYGQKTHAKAGVKPERLDNEGDADYKLEWEMVYGPLWDGVAVASNFRELLEKGLPPAAELRNGNKGLMVSMTQDEGTLFHVLEHTKAAAEGILARYQPNLRNEVRRLYAADDLTDDGVSPFSMLTRATADTNFHAPIRRLWHCLATEASAPPSYASIFAHQPSRTLLEGFAGPEMAPTFHQLLGVFHAADLAFVFAFQGEGKEGVELGKGFTPAERALVRRMIGDLATFVKGGEPWTPLGAAGAKSRIQDLPIRSYGHRPPRHVTLAPVDEGVKKAVARDDAGQLQQSEASIDVADVRLGEHFNWTHGAGKGEASTEEKQAFWVGLVGEGKPFQGTWRNYYGDDRVGIMQ